MPALKGSVPARTMLASLTVAVSVGAAAVPTVMAQEGFLGEIRMVGFTFCPRGWAETNGQLLSIAQNTALFSLLGTTYGGDGRTTFALPDLRGRVPKGQGNGPGLANVLLGARGGAENHTLSVSELPSHTHTVVAQATTEVTVKQAQGQGQQQTLTVIGEGGGVGDSGPTGNNQAHNILNPFLGMRFCIATQGIFPSRN